jgi:4-amino-4-deoxy-L-arabinose transferase-like glycosyltransferase
MGLDGWSGLGAKNQSLPWSAFVTLVVYGSAIFLLGQLGPWYLSKHEVFYSQTAREMLASGNWFVPTLAGRPSLQKPPLVYWSIALAMELFHSQSEWVVRFPSVMAALIAAAFVADMAARRLSIRVGLLAGLIQVSSLWTIIKARQAVPDMILVAAVAGAMWAFTTANLGYRASRRGDRWLAKVFYLCEGAALLVKGPTGAALTIPSTLLFILLERDRKAWRFFLDPLGVLLFVVVGVAWPVAVYHHYPQLLQIWRFENLDRFMGSRGMALDQNSHFAYLGDVLWCTAPWTPFLFLGGLRISKSEFREKPIWRFLALWFLVGLLQLSLGASKRFQYAMPIFPPLSILAARGLDAAIGAYPLPIGRRLVAALAFLLAFLALITPEIAAIPEATRIASGLVLLTCAGLLTAHLMGQRSRPLLLAAITFATIGLVAVLAQTFVMPAFDPNVSQIEFAKAVNQRVPPNQRLYAINPAGLHFPYFLEIAFYLHSPLTPFERVADLQKELRDTASRSGYVIIDPFFENQVARLGHVELIQEEADASGKADPIGHLMLIKVKVDAD